MSTIPAMIGPTQCLYLSIDLDFWNRRSLAECRRVLEHVAERHGDIAIVDEHQDLLLDINRTEPDTVINLDFHSDIANNNGEDEWLEYDEREDDHKTQLNCGTWGNWVHQEWRQHFLWLYPSGTPMDDALCHWPRERRCSPFSTPKSAGWKKVSKKAVKSFPYYLIDRAVTVGLAISSEWLDTIRRKDMWDIVRDIFGQKKFQKALDFDL